MSRRSRAVAVAIATLSCCAVPAAAHADAIPAQSLIANGSFEGTTDEAALAGWAGAPTTGIITRDTNAPKFGASAAKVTVPSGGGTLLRDAPVVPKTQARRTYTAVVWLKGTAGQKLRLRLRDRYPELPDDPATPANDPKPAWTAASNTTVVTLTAAYKRYAVSFTPTRDDHTLHLELQAGANVSPFYVDGASVTTNALPDDNGVLNPSFETASGGVFATDTKTGWNTYNAERVSVQNLASASVNGVASDKIPASAFSPFGSWALEVRPTDAYGSVFSDSPGGVERSSAGVKYGGRVWIAGVAGVPGTSGESTIGATARVTIRERTQDFQNVGTPKTVDVTLGAGYREAVVPAYTATASNNRIEMTVGLVRSTTPAAGTRFRIDGATITPDVVAPSPGRINGGFEEDTAGWTPFGPTAATTPTLSTGVPAAGQTGPPQGRSSALVTAKFASTPASGSDWYSVNADGAVPYTYAKAAYTATAWVGGTSTSNGKSVVLGLREVRADGTKVGTDAESSAVALSSSAYKQLTVSRPAVESGNRLQVYVVRPGGGTNGESFRVDAVGVTEGPVLGRPASGSGSTAFKPDATCAFTVAAPSNPAGAAPWWPPSCWRPFSPTSPFNTAAGTNYQYSGVDPTIQDLAKEAPQAIIAGERDRTEPNPTFYAKSSDPVWTIKCRNEDWTPNTCTNSASSPLKIKAPEGMKQAAWAITTTSNLTDAHLTVVDQAAKTETDMWQVTKIDDANHVIETSTSAKNAGVGTDPSAPQQSGDGDGTNAYGSGNAGFSNMAGIIRAQELEDGRINHALAVYLPCADGEDAANTRPVSPGAITNKPDYPCGPANMFQGHAPKVGQRMKLDMSSAEIAALDIPLWRKAILQALATYGAYVSDTTPNYCDGPGPGAYAYRPNNNPPACAGDTPYEVQQWGFEFEGSTTYTAAAGGSRRDEFSVFGDKPGVDVNGFDESGNGVEETAFDLGAGVDWSRLRMMALPAPRN